MFRDAELDVPIHSIGVPLEFIEHSKRGEIMTDLGITAQNITHKLVSWSSSLKTDLKSELMPEKQLPADENSPR
jgi:1-deoxy-D-xylulose-5-phosphate synthase